MCIPCVIACLLTVEQHFYKLFCPAFVDNEDNTYMVSVSLLIVLNVANT
jgi:hypothetical protein